MKILLSLFTCFTSIGFAFAQDAEQEPVYEQQWVVLATGEEVSRWIYLDEQTELLHIKPDQKAEVEFYRPHEVVSFSYGSHRYFSMPIDDQQYAFFQVVHEGQEFAVLEKTPNYKALRAIAAMEPGLAVCQNIDNQEYYLCYPGVYQRSPLSNISFNGSPNTNWKFTIDVDEFRVLKLVYLAVEGHFDLFYMETKEEMMKIDDGEGSLPANNRRVGPLLQDFIQDEEKISKIKARVKDQKLDIRLPTHLVEALLAVYR